MNRSNTHRYQAARAAIRLPHHLGSSASERAILLDGLDLLRVKRDIVAYLKSLRPENTSRDVDHLSLVARRGFAQVTKWTSPEVG